MPRKDLIQLRRDTTANWQKYNPVLEAGEIGVDIGFNRFKFGDGVNKWNNLDYAAVSPSSGGIVSSFVDFQGGLTISGSALSFSSRSGPAFIMSDGPISVDASLVGTSGSTITGFSSPDVDSSGFRNITLSTSDPSGGSDGDVWLVYS